jgi:parvulin-like peptidyl-prolyl isomerase
MISFRPQPATSGFRPAFSAALAALLVGAALSTSSCHQAVTDPNDPKFIVAEKGDWTITRAQLTDQINAFLKANNKAISDVPPAKMPMLETEMLQNMVLKKLILEQAATLPLKDVDKDEAGILAELKGHFPTEADFDGQLKTAGMTLDELKKQIHENVLIQKTMELEAFHDIQPTDQEIDDFYMKNKDKFDVPDKIRASRVVIMVDQAATPAQKAAKKKEIDKAHARVLKGEDFSKVASEVSEDQYSKPKGGDIGYFQKGENEADFDDVAFATKPGMVSPVFETPMGYEFLKVTDVHPGGDISVAQARDSIAKYLSEAKESQEEKDYTTKLLASSGVKFHLVQVNLPDSPTNAAPADASASTNAPAAAPSPAAATNAAPQ